MLEEILAPVKAIDEIVERQYAKVRGYLDEKNINVCYIALPLNFIFLATPPLSENFSLRMFEGAYAGLDIVVNLEGLYKKEDKVSDGPSVARLSNGNSRITNALRLPVFLTGAALTAFGTYQLVDSYVSSQNSDNHEWLRNVGIGFAWLCQASSVYLKNSDPKVLDKKPMWKNALEKVVGFYESAKPQPAMVPAPGQGPNMRLIE